MGHRGVAFRVSLFITGTLALTAVALLFSPWRDVGFVLFLPLVFSARRLHQAFHDDDARREEPTASVNRRA